LSGGRPSALRWFGIFFGVRGIIAARSASIQQDTLFVWGEPRAGAGLKGEGALAVLAQEEGLGLTGVNRGIYDSLNAGKELRRMGSLSKNAKCESSHQAGRRGACATPHSVGRGPHL
jgi:hypothetical protein